MNEVIGMPKRMMVAGIQNRIVQFLEDFPEPRVYIYGIPVYDIVVRIDDRTYLLELYHSRLIKMLKAAGSLKGRKAMIQLPEQEGANWGAWVFA